MATRFYLPSSGAAAVNPAFDGGWEQNTGADRLRCVLTPSGTAMANKTITGPGVTPADVLNRQYVSDGFPAQTITGTIQGQIRADANNAAKRSIVVRVVSNDGNTFRGTLFSVFNTGANFNTTLRNANYPISSAVTSQTLQANDRLVFDIGWTQSSVTGTICDLNFGDNGGSDLPIDETTTSALNPWIEFSFNISTGLSIPQFMLLGVGT